MLLIGKFCFIPLNRVGISSRLLVSYLDSGLLLNFLGYFRGIFFLIYLFIFIFGCVGSLFLCEGFLQLRQAGATLHRGARASHYRGLSCCGAQDPDAQAQ